jgi:hypothetical protein
VKNRWFALTLAVIGCGPQPIEPDTQADGSDESTATGTAGETGLPPCFELECQAGCADELDECGRALTGLCTRAGACACVQVDPPCVECAQTNCPSGEWCNGEFGICEPCRGEVPFSNDPPGSCQLTIHDLPYLGIPYVIMTIDGVEFYHEFDCANEDPLAFTWLVEGETMLLCEQACLAFHAAREVTIGFYPLGCQ